MKLKHPHDKLLVQGKKTAILSPDKLVIGEPIDIDVGILVLDAPAQMLPDEADRKEWFEQHRVRKQERESWWPGATRFYVYPVRSFEVTTEDWRDPKTFGVKGDDEMPYALEKRDDEFCVVKEETGEPVDGGCHPTKDEAEAHLTALRINVEAEEKQADDEDILATLVERHIDEIESVDTQVEPDTIEEPETPKGPELVQENGTLFVEDDLRAAYRARYGDRDPVEVLNEVLAQQEERMAVPEQKAGRRVKKPMLQRLKDAFTTLKEMLAWAEYDETENNNIGGFEMKGDTGFALKQVNGKPWIWSWTTNAFVDRDQEIFSTKGLEQYVAEADRKDERGGYNLWHVKGTEFADVAVQGVIGRILVEGGPFRDDAKGKAARVFFEKYPDGHPEYAPEGWGCSPEFRYLPEERKSGVFDNFWITDRAILPKWAAANVQTAGGGIMALTKQQEEMFKAALGEDEFEKIVTSAEKKTEELEQQMAFKALDASKVCKRLRGMASKADDGMKKALMALADEIEGGDDEEDMSDEEEKSAEIDLEELAGHLAKHFDVDISAVVEQTEKQATQIEEQQRQIEALMAELKAKKSDGTRFVMQLEKRASEAAETVVEDGDHLLKMKPAETLPPKKSGAANFFPAVR